MKRRPWIPLHIEDYLRKTTHLRALESGAYLHLIMAYWRDGGLPDDDRQLATIAKLTDSEWRRLKPVLAKFFGPGWTSHKRLDEEIAKSVDISGKRHDAAMKRHRENIIDASSNIHAFAPANAPAKA